MGERRALRAGTSGGVGAMAGLLVVAIAIMAVAAEVPLLQAAGLVADPQEEQAALHRAIAEERAWLARALNESWRAVSLEETEPGVRARTAAANLQGAIAARYPHEVGRWRIELNASELELPDDASDRLPPEIEVQATVALRAWQAGVSARDFLLEAAAADPWSPRGRAHLEGALREIATDPQAALGAALRREGARWIEADRSTSLVEEALAIAADELAWELATPEDAGRAHPAAPSAGAPPPSDEQAAAALAVAPATELCAFATQLANASVPRPADVAFALAVACAGLAGAAAIAAALRGDRGPLLRAIAALADLAGARMEGVAAFLQGTARAFAWAAANASERARQFLDTLVPGPLGARASAPGVEVTLTGGAVSATLEPVGGLSAPGLPPIAVLRATVAFPLSATVRLLDGGRWLEAQMATPVSFVFPLAAARAAANASSPPEPPPAAPPALAAERAELAAQQASWLDDLRREVDRRLITFRDAVSERIQRSSATTLARLAMRVLIDMADGEHNRSARALFELMERTFADDLARALTVNFTLWGVPFTLLPDPLRQSVSLEHQEGPHTYGVRVRRIMQPENPFVPLHADHASLALELYWKYSAAPVTASLVLDPFLRTGDGLVRFGLRIEGGDGLLISMVAPNIVRRAGSLDLSLSDFIPGGVPLAPTPTGGLVSFDAGVRVEFARVAPAALWMFVARAAADAILDALANQTVQEAGERFAAGPLARSFLRHLVDRLADAFAAAASRFVLRADLFARLRWAEALGAADAKFEFGVAALEPMLVLRAEASALADLIEAASRGPPPRPGVSGRLIDALPSAVHERIGLTASLTARAGLNGVPIVGRWFDELPHAAVGETVFASLGALAAATGRRSLHWVSEFAIGFEVGTIAAPVLRHLGLRRADTLEAVHMRVESLSGPRILIAEVLPAPRGQDSDLEFVELYNPGLVEEDLTDWSLSDGTGHRFELPAGTRIGAGRTLVLARSALAFFERFRAVADVPTLTLRINDQGDRLRLENARGWVSDTVEWGQGSLRPGGLAPDTSLARQRAAVAPSDLPGSGLRFTGSWTDFAPSPPSPGRTP